MYYHIQNWCFEQNKYVEVFYYVAYVSLKGKGGKLVKQFMVGT